MRQGPRSVGDPPPPPRVSARCGFALVSCTCQSSCLFLLTRCRCSLLSSQPGPQHGTRPLLPRFPQTTHARQVGAIDLTKDPGAVVGGGRGGLASQSVKGHRSKCNIFLSRLINTVCLHGLEKSTAHSPLIPVVICSIKCDNGRAPWLFPRPLRPARPGGPAEGCVRVIASPRGPASHHAARRISPSPPLRLRVHADSGHDSVSRAEPPGSLHSALRVLALSESVRWERNAVLAPAAMNSFGEANHHSFVP